MMRVPFADLPGTTRLFNDYVGNQESIRAFYPHSYDLSSIASFARTCVAGPHLDSVCSILREQQRHMGNDASSVDKLNSGAVVVISGQQPGLFTGPLYTILKAITAIKLAADLEAQGVSAVPLFWIAAEDHDFEEIQWTAVLDREAALHRLRVDLANGDATPVGWLQFRDDVSGAISEALESLPQSEFQPELRDLLESTYRPGVSPVHAFGSMLARLFRGAGLLVADPLDPGLKRIAAPLLLETVRRNDEIRSAVLARSRAISDAGYHEQVKVDDAFTGLFALRGRSRLAVRPNELDSAAGEVLSPNVLVRPMIQDMLFPTAAYVGGPAEVAYFAQAASVYEVFGRSAPPVYPRISATILEARVARALKKYDLEVLDAFQGRESMKRKAVESIQGGEQFDRVRDRVAAEAESLRASLVALDPTLAGALETAKQKMLHQIEGLRTRFVNAEARRNEALERQLELIVNSLYPEKKFQERIVNITSFVDRYGSGFVQRLSDALSLDSREHQVVDI